ncbi:BTAD domain-containing putative transcriptional regulator [Dactylosporangium sp. NPDC005572]|uniref:AfsR/SARP family transcriptional regulator n=1 Tax=Dactylosporangium sp. NPDC005572 TaxID=3156889 RepID=UPI00339F1CE3
MSSQADITFLMLGPLRVEARGGPPQASLDPLHERALAALLVDAGHDVTVDRLAAAVWTDEPLARPRHEVDEVVSGLRQVLAALGAHDQLIGAGSGGYRLAPDRCTVDALEFDATVDAAVAQPHHGRTHITLLRQALALWRGPALAGLDVPALNHAVAALEERRLSAWEHCLSLELDARAGAEVLAELIEFTDNHPARERPAQLLMLALHRQGRNAEALSVFDRTQRRLLGHLGREPGAGLRKARDLVVRGLVQAAQPSRRVAARSGAVRLVHQVTPVRPAQLPAATPGFTGRLAALQWLDAGTAPSLVCGAAGVGKTALAVFWARRAAARFPDGHLYLDLRGSGPAPLAPLCALWRLLPALGVPRHLLPADLEEASALYRSLLDGKRMLVLLDDAVSAEQVRPLLPGEPGSVTLVLARHPLAELVAREGVRLHDLPPMTAAESRQLLATRLGRERVQAEPEAVAQLVELCGGSPRALGAVAAAVSTRAPAALAAVAAELRQIPFGALLTMPAATRQL